MIILAVDTSTQVAGVVVANEEKILSEYIIQHKRTHSQKLMPMIDEVLKQLGILPKEIDVYGVVTGPGSFTGLRIGISTIKGMAYANDKPIVGVPTLETMAYNIAPSESVVCPILDARNNQVFTCLYEWKEDRYCEISESMGIGIDELTERVKNNNRKTIFLGDAVDLHKDYLSETLGEQASFAPSHLLNMKPSSLLYGVNLRLKKKEFSNAYDLNPFYLRPSQAERLAGNI